MLKCRFSLESDLYTLGIIIGINSIVVVVVVEFQIVGPTSTSSYNVRFRG